jgi:hypothetical protein
MDEFNHSINQYINTMIENMMVTIKEHIDEKLEMDGLTDVEKELQEIDIKIRYLKSLLD